MTAVLVLRHHAPFRHHGFAHLPGVLRAGDFVDLDRDFLADETLQLRGLRVLEVISWNVSGPVSKLQSPLGGGSRRGSLVI